jgi:hypothetical protein
MEKKHLPRTHEKLQGQSQTKEKKRLAVKQN